MSPALRAVALTLTSLLLCTPSGPVNAAPGTLRGVVDNGTRGRAVPDGLEVEIVQLDAAGAELDRTTKNVDEAGRFTTPALDETRAERVVVSTLYKGVGYQSTVEPAGGTGRVRLTIFEPTSDPNVISVRSDTTVATREGEDELAVLHLLRINNRSDRTFVGEVVDGRPAVLRLPVPREAFDLRAVEGLTHEAITDVEGGIASGDPLQPGEARISYAYGVRADDGRWSLGHAVEYPTQRADVLVQPDLVVSSPGRNLGSLSFDDRRYRQFEFGPLLPNQTVAVLVNPPGGGPPVAALVIAVAAALVVAVMLIRRRRRASDTSPAEEEHERLVAAIADLDNHFAAGRIDEDTYRSRRRAIKGELLALES